MKAKLLVSLLFIILAGVFIITKSNSQVGTKQYVVKLYAGDKVVGTWDSYAIGNSDGQSITFFVGSQTYPQQVRISGTFSVEQVK